MRTVVIALGVLFGFISSAAAQSVDCSAGRLIVTAQYADLITDYPGTATVVEGCAAVCDAGPPSDRIGCLALACGVSCLIVGLDNCMDYYSKKVDIDDTSANVERICKREHRNDVQDARRRDQSAWAVAHAASTKSGYERYLRDCKNPCAFRTQARKEVASIERAARQAKRLEREAQARAAERRAKQAREAEAAKYDRDRRAWSAASATGTKPAYQTYLRQCEYPCAHRDTAQDEVRRIQQVERDTRRREKKARIAAKLKPSSTSPTVDASRALRRPRNVNRDSYLSSLSLAPILPQLVLFTPVVILAALGS